MRCAVLPLALLLLGGCAQFEYDLIAPESLARHIGASETTISLDPVVYHLVSYDSRLVMTVENPTTQPVQLLGDQCDVVDAKGQSHPLRDEAIAPGDSLKLIFPPFPDRTPGPTFIINLSGTTRPVESDPYVFDWDDEGNVSMTLVYFYNDTRVEHLLAFHRRRI